MDPMHPQSAYSNNIYLIRKTVEDDRPVEEIQEMFFDSLGADPRMAGGLRRLYNEDTGDLIEGWFADLEQEMDVKWLAH